MTELNFEQRLVAAEREIIDVLEEINRKLLDDESLGCWPLADEVGRAIHGVKVACAIARDYARRPEGE